MTYLDYLEINEDRPYFSEQFCNDIINEAELNYYYWYAEFRSDIELYDKDEKLKIFKSKIDELRKNLELSDCKIHFSVKDVKKSLERCLVDFFRLQSIAEATAVEYDLRMKEGIFEYNSLKKRLRVYPAVSYLMRDSQFDFALLDEFKPLVTYVAWCLFFNKLKKMEAKIIRPKIASDTEKKNKKKKEQIGNVVIPILAVDDNGIFIHEPLSLEENYNEKDGKIIEESDILENKDIKILSSEAGVNGQNELPNTQIKQQTLYLADVFESKTRYIHIMNILVTAKKCHPESYIWIGTEKGDYSYLAAILKHLHALGYYKDKRLTHDEIRQICKNTFKMEISIDTIKKANPENFDLKLIPLASTLNL